MKQLQNLSLVTPGFFGLNTQESGVTISPNFAQLTDNVVIDKYGRLGARKGWVMKTQSGDTSLGGNSVKFMMEHVNADDTTTVLSGGNSKVWKGGVDASLTDITPTTPPYTVSADRWKGASIYDHALLVQDGQEPLVYTEAATPNCQTLTVYSVGGIDSSVADYASLPGSPTTGDKVHTQDTNSVYEYDGSAWNDITKIQLFGTSYPRDVIAAYGRFWTHNGETVYWSTDIADTAFPGFYGGTAGTLNISGILPNSTDTIVALAAHNNFLIIFCKNNIVLYGGALNPIGEEFALADVITGVGCVARDSVQSTGNDLIFLSDTGIRSLGRLIQEKSLPMRDLTKNIRDDFLKDLTEEITNSGDLDDVVSVYSEKNAFYLISFPSVSTVYCLDMRQPLEDGAARVTVWFTYEADSFLRRRNRDLLIGKTNGMGLYDGYDDNNQAFRIRYFSHYVDFGNPAVLKMMKQISATVIGGQSQDFIIKCGFDYDQNANSYAFKIPSYGAVAEFGIAEYVAYTEFNGTVADYASLPGSPSDGDAYMTLDDNSVYQWDAGTSTWNDITSTWETTFTVSSSSEYTSGIVIDKLKSSVGGSGNVVQIGFEADVNGSELSVQKFDVFVKTGRVS